MKSNNPTQPNTPESDIELEEQICQLVDRAKGYGYPMTTIKATEAIMALLRKDREAVARATEIKILKQIENMGDGEAKRQGMFTAHNMNGYHQAYGDIVSHNVHVRLAALNQQKQKGK